MKFVDIDDTQIFTVGDEKVPFNYSSSSNLVLRTLKIESLDFFEKWHFFQKKVTDQYILHFSKPQFT